MSWIGCPEVIFEFSDGYHGEKGWTKFEIGHNGYGSGDDAYISITVESKGTPEYEDAEVLSTITLDEARQLIAGLEFVLSCYRKAP